MGQAELGQVLRWGEVEKLLRLSSCFIGVILSHVRKEQFPKSLQRLPTSSSTQGKSFLFLSLSFPPVERMSSPGSLERL